VVMARRRMGTDELFDWAFAALAGASEQLD
jgi:hypothetical protein